MTLLSKNEETSSVEWTILLSGINIPYLHSRKPNHSNLEGLCSKVSIYHGLESSYSIPNICSRRSYASGLPSTLNFLRHINKIFHFHHHYFKYVQEFSSWEWIPLLSQRFITVLLIVFLRFAYFDQHWVHDQPLVPIKPTENEGFVTILAGKNSSI